MGRHSRGFRFDGVEEARDLLRLRRELRAREDGPILRQHPIVHEERYLSRQEEIHNSPGILARVEEARDQDVRVEDDPQAGRRRRRTAAISRLISAMGMRSLPVSAALRRIRETARIALARLIAATVSSRRVSSTPSRTPIGFPFAVSTTSSFESTDHTRPGRFRSSRMLTYFMPKRSTFG